MIKASITRKNKGGGLDALRDKLSSALESGINAALEDTQKLAVERSKDAGKSGYVPNRPRMENRIFTKVTEKNDLLIRGMVFTNAPFAAFLEWGTGTKMEENPLGHIPGSAGARGEPWFVPKSKADLSKYHFPTFDYKSIGMDGKETVETYFVIRGTEPHPYMKPAALQGRKKNVEDVENALREQVKEVSL